MSPYPIPRTLQYYPFFHRYVREGKPHSQEFISFPHSSNNPQSWSGKRRIPKFSHFDFFSLTKLRGKRDPGTTHKQMYYSTNSRWRRRKKGKVSRENELTNYQFSPPFLKFFFQPSDRKWDKKTKVNCNFLNNRGLSSETCRNFNCVRTYVEVVVYTHTCTVRITINSLFPSSPFAGERKEEYNFQEKGEEDLFPFILFFSLLSRN